MLDFIIYSCLFSIIFTAFSLVGLLALWNYFASKKMMKKLMKESLELTKELTKELENEYY